MGRERYFTILAFKHALFEHLQVKIIAASLTMNLSFTLFLLMMSILSFMDFDGSAYN